MRCTLTYVSHPHSAHPYLNPTHRYDKGLEHKPQRLPPGMFAWMAMIYNYPEAVRTCLVLSCSTCLCVWLGLGIQPSRF